MSAEGDTKQEKTTNCFYLSSPDDHLTNHNLAHLNNQMRWVVLLWLLIITFVKCSNKVLLFWVIIYMECEKKITGVLKYLAIVNYVLLFLLNAIMTSQSMFSIEIGSKTLFYTFCFPQQNASKCKKLKLSWYKTWITVCIFL